MEARVLETALLTPSASGGVSRRGDLGYPAYPALVGKPDETLAASFWDTRAGGRGRVPGIR